VSPPKLAALHFCNVAVKTPPPGNILNLLLFGVLTENRRLYWQCGGEDTATRNILLTSYFLTSYFSVSPPKIADLYFKTMWR
jgi:hypothetical protein